MAEELKKKFQEMQEAKHGKREELKIDEFEWIEVRQRILSYLAEQNRFSSKTFQLNKQLEVDRNSGKRHQETPNEKLIRKFKENPLIPMGCLLTTGFLVNGLFKFGRRDSAGSQVMMRGRIAAQVKGIYREQAISLNAICVKSFLLRLNSPMHYKMQ